jgi:hypothetical protein
MVTAPIIRECVAELAKQTFETVDDSCQLDIAPEAEGYRFGLHLRLVVVDFDL